VPTDEELDALAAYQLSLGRQEDFNLKTLELKSTLAASGKTMFLDTGTIFEKGHKNCNACHFNAGATTGISLNSATPNFSPLLDGNARASDGNARGFNMASPTNTNGIKPDPSLPPDGGFGVIPVGGGAFGNTAAIPKGVIDVAEFNSPSLLDADAPPFFHNN